MNLKTLFLIPTALWSLTALAVSRPPQFVNLAFDGSKSTRMWQETTEFAQQQNINFSYFVSGVYFIPDSDRTSYTAPGYRAGRSNIGFGGNPQDISSRNAWVEHAYNSGNEIASHANGHYDGSSWSYEGWYSELTQFLVSFGFSAQNYGGVRDLNTWGDLSSINMKGFRAPLLGNNSNMFEALRALNFEYDTSEVRNMNYWPKRQNGIWRMPLAALRMVGSGKRTLSMDYNMYVAQSGGSAGNSANYAQWEEEVYQTYLRYFKSNYLGNRAPVDIGHHFSLWNGGIYWKAMKRFATTVCHLPEVHCGTYTELTNFLNRTPEATLNAYQSGDFPRASAAALPALVQNASIQQNSDTHFSREELEEMKASMCPPEAHLEEEEINKTAPVGGGIYL